MTPTSENELPDTIAGIGGLAAMSIRLRAARGLSEAQLAAKVGRPARFVARIEASEVRAPTLLTAMLLARACEVSVTLFVASFALPREDPLPWPREHRPPERTPDAVPGAAAMGATLRRLRLDRNWSQYDLAMRSGLSQSKISHLERGAGVAPRLLTVTRLSRAFAAVTALQISYAAQLAQAYAGEVEAPPLSGNQRDRLEPRAGLD